MSKAIDPPVTPRASVLPIGDLTWERFEAFAHDLLMALPWVDSATAHPHGTKGQAQEGIDVTVVGTDGLRWGFSNKRYEKYKEHHVTKHVADTTYKADRYVILISGIASPSVRNKIREHPNWELWDAQDLSTRLRQGLTPEAARRIVDHHFGTTWRRDFLGLPAIGAFLSPLDYFRPLLDTHHLFHHGLSLVGRKDQLADLIAFATHEVRRVAVLRGRGGIGKSRLLREWATQLEAEQPPLTIRFASEGVPINSAALDELPAAPCLVVVDDAHRRTDLGILLAWIRMRPTTRLLLSTRLQGLDYLNAQLSRANFDTTEIFRPLPLESLSKAEVRQLAGDVLGPEKSSLVEPLTRSTRDCPLLTVVGGRLLVHQPDLLQREADFRGEVLDRFRDERLGSISQLFPESMLRKILEFVAVLAPVPLDAGLFAEELAPTLGIAAPEIVRAVAELAKVGVLLRRGRQLRIVPDILGDHILTEACITEQGQPTGFADQVFDLFGTTQLDHMLRNLSELDWRTRHYKSIDSGLLNKIWQRLDETFRQGNNCKRAEILREIEDSAYFLPGRVLELCVYAVANPQPAAQSGDFSYKSVLRYIPPLLATCALSGDHRRACINLLWQLAQKDGRSRRPSSNHTLSVLTDLARCVPGKSLEVSGAVLARVRAWLSSSVDWDAACSPFDVLDVLFERTGTRSDAIGHAVRLTPYILSYDSYQTFRTGAMDVLASSAQSTDARTLIRVVQSLGRLLSPPSGTGTQFPVKLADQWEPEQLRALSILQQLTARDVHPLVLLAVVKQVGQKDFIGPSSRVQDRAGEVLSQITWTLDLKLTRVLMPNTRGDELEDQIQDETLSQEERLRIFCSAVASEMWKLFPDPGVLAADLESRVRALRVVDPSADAGYFVQWLVDANTAAGEPFLRKVIALGDTCIAGSLGDGLARLHQYESAGALKLAAELVNSDVVAFRRSAGHHVAWNLRGQTVADEVELSVNRRLLNDPVPELRRYGVEALCRIAPSSPRQILDLLKPVDSSGDPTIVYTLCRLSDRAGVVDHLTHLDIVDILGRIEGLDSIEGPIARFVAFASGRCAAEVVDMLLRRIQDDAKRNGGEDYTPIPRRSLREAFKGLQDTEGHADLLRRVRKAARAATHGSIEDFARLFSDLSQRYQGVGLQVLEEWLTKGKADQVLTAAQLWQLAPACFVPDNLALIERTLEHAESLGPDCLSKVHGELYHGEINRAKRGEPGKPFPEDVVLRDRCRDALSQLDSGSLAAELLRDLVSHAELNIKRKVDHAWEED